MAFFGSDGGPYKVKLCLSGVGVGLRAMSRDCPGKFRTAGIVENVENGGNNRTEGLCGVKRSSSSKQE